MIGVLNIESITSFSREYDFLSNFKWCEVEYDGMKFPSVEHAYQSAKTIKANRHLFLTGTAGQAKKIGQDVPMVNNWQDIKVGVMISLLRQKFAPGSELARKLIMTMDAELVEGNWWGDTFWGVCRGKGQNVLGKLLMQIRTELNLVSQMSFK